MPGDVLRIAPEERSQGAATPGMIREQAFATARTWVGLVRTGAGMVSGWHHHGEYETAIYVLSGAMRMEFGPGGGHVLDSGPDDFVYVPPKTVHRESNPTEEESQLVVFRAGEGNAVVNVDGPDQE